MVLLFALTLAVSKADAQFKFAKVIAETTPQCSSSFCDRDAIVFIHGIFGSRETWLHPDGNQTWPEMFARDADLKEFDVYRVDYESRFLVSGPRPSGTEIAEAVFQELRPVLAPYARVHIVAHSHGGNLMRYYLVRLKTETLTPPGPHAVLSRYRDLIFLGTPSEGAQIANIAQFASNNRTLKILEPIDANEWLQTVNNMWSGVVFRTQLYAADRPVPLKLYAVYERQPYLGTLVVPKTSATALGPFQSQCVERNHSSIAKPRDQSDVVYRWVKAVVLARQPPDLSGCQ